MAMLRPLVDKVKKRFALPEYGILKMENGVEIQQCGQEISIRNAHFFGSFSNQPFYACA
jgi:hypothetical protein